MPVHKATRAQMQERYEILYKITEAEQPISSRGVCYRTLGITASPGVLGNPGTTAIKGDNWDALVSLALIYMRRTGMLPHEWIVEPGRKTRRPNTWTSAGELMSAFAPGFRRSLWTDLDHYVEV
jgi:hypothetical protein